jgi:ribonuclease HI
LIDKTILCAYFNGAYEGDPRVCAVGGILFLEKNHSFVINTRLVPNSNNLVELMAF